MYPKYVHAHANINIQLNIIRVLTISIKPGLVRLIEATKKKVLFQ